MKQNYLDAVANAFHEAKAWKYACFVLTGVCAALTIGLVYEAGNTPTVLVPADFANSSGPIKIVAKNGSSKTDGEYLSQLAMGDLATVLNWTPLTVLTQHQRFLNRMTPELYAAQNIKMMNEADGYKSSSVTESFYPTESKVDVLHNQANVSGTLVRWTGEKETLRVNATYQITYAKYKGFLHVSGLQIQK